MKLFRIYKLHIAGLIIGAIGGWIYWYNWGCVESCPIRSNALHSTLYGAVMGMLLLGMFDKEQSKKHDKLEKSESLSNETNFKKQITINKSE